ncbi:MAG: WYL domain-containing protein [Planctomycetales bacterium]
MAAIDRIHRVLRLVELLQSGRGYNSAQLARECGVSRRTIFRDLKTLHESGIGVRYDERAQTYALPSRTVLPATEFNLDEALALLVLCQELGAENGIPFQKSARTAALKLASCLPGALRDSVNQLAANISVRLDPHNPLNGSEDIFDLLQRSLAERRRIRLEYHSLFEGGRITTLVSPYRLHYGRRSWYVIGRSSLHRAVRTFNVGRIGKAELVDSRYAIPPRFSLDRHLGNAWNLIRERGRRCDVVVRFQPQVAHNVAEVKWHKTQRAAWNDDGTLDLRVTVDGLGEIAWWVLGYGDQAEVLQPPELRDELRRRIDNLRAIYAPTANATAKAAAPRSRGRRSKR